MKSSQPLQIIGGIVGLGIIGVATIYLLTKSDEENDAPKHDEPFDPISPRSAISVPVTFDDEPSSGNPVIPAGQLVSFTLSPPYSSSVGSGSVDFLIVATSLDYSNTGQPLRVQFDTAPFPNPVTVTMGSSRAFYFAVKDTGNQQHISVSVSGRAASGQTYKNQVPITVMPQAHPVPEGEPAE